ncbi:MAG TPA: glycoside hydrolase family 9 protein, partial [Pedobacter sp.]|nr:glycoside hydrolase family 9 protein [Pedobacter sp.]
FDFTKITRPGMYVVKYGTRQSEPFQISESVFKNDVWQPTLAYFMPAQMCHMRINDKYRVWHGLCHMDDARMAPVDSNHFDGYLSGHSTLTKFNPGDNIPFLNKGAWHDAGDFDLRIESQAETIHGLTLAYEQFGSKYDNTTIDQKNHLVEIQQPDGKPDLLQQIEHGLLSITGGYQAMGRFYRGVIEPTLRQYVLLGDAANITDNKPFVINAVDNDLVLTPSSPADDRWVFTEDNPQRSLQTAAALAAASRVMKGYNDTLSTQCLEIATRMWQDNKNVNPEWKTALATELLITTRNKEYSDFLVANVAGMSELFENNGWLLSRTVNLIDNRVYKDKITDAVKKFYIKVQEQSRKTPYGVPYEPSIWGAGWGIQNFGYRQYFLYASFPDIFPGDYMLHAMNFVLGCHPGSNTSSFVSGVGAKSMTTAYGFNRADLSYIPGGITSGTTLIRPDFPELLNWPYLWQQGEYVLGGGTSDYLFLVMAADHILNRKN